VFSRWTEEKESDILSIDFGTDIYEEPIVAKTFLSEDAQEGSLRPKTLQEYIGQEKAKGNLAVFIAAAKKRGARQVSARRRLRVSLPRKWASISASPPVPPSKRRATLRRC
jgi:hypothetical protein